MFFRPTLKIQMTNIDPNIRPSKANKHDACFDVRTDIEEFYDVGDHFIELPFKVEFSKKYFLEFRPKSGLSKNYGFTIINTPGTVDYGYKENVCLNFRITRPMHVKYGQKIAQMRLERKLHERIKFVDRISDKHDRGGGHGSSGIF